MQKNPFYHQKKFNQVPAVRFQKSALVGKVRHSGSQPHEMAIQREHNKRVPYFHKGFETQLLQPEMDVTLFIQLSNETF